MTDLSHVKPFTATADQTWDISACQSCLKQCQVAFYMVHYEQNLNPHQIPFLLISAKIFMFLLHKYT